MVKLKDLTGQRFGKLIVIDIAENIYENGKRVNSGTRWLCRCDCSNEIIVYADRLKTEHVKSCGCLKTPNLVGKKIGKLIVLSRIEKLDKNGCVLWLTKCDCGNTREVKTSKLNRGAVVSCGCNKFNPPILSGTKFGRLTVLNRSSDYIFNNRKHIMYSCKCECGTIRDFKERMLLTETTKSCGCLHRDIKRSKDDDFKWDGPFTEEICGARHVWRKYVALDKEKLMYEENNKLTFSLFFEMSKQNCVHCGIGPSNSPPKYEGKFIYNGLDRIDNSKGHNPGNIQVSCFRCNMARGKRTIEEFYDWIPKLQIKTFTPYVIKNLNIPPKINFIVKDVMKSKYSDTDLTIDQFYWFTQHKCFYCKENPFNKKGGENGFTYSGLDRIDSSLGHIAQNLVPCCKWCNFSKSNLTLNDFNIWINRIQTYQNRKSSNKPSF